MMTQYRIIWLTAAVLIGTGLSTSDASAANYYEKKAINLIIGSDVGGGFDIYGRLIARHLARFILGAPTVVVQNMPGAGGSKAPAYLYSHAAKDGLTIMTTQPAAIVGPLFEAYSGNILYDATKFLYIGSADSSTKVCVTSEKSAIKTMEDARRLKGTLGATGSGSARDYAYLLNRAGDTKFRVVSGYKGFPDILLAMDRGEVDGFCGLDWPSLKAQRPDMIRDKTLNVFVQFDLAEDKELSALKVPSIFDYAKAEEKKAIVKLYISQQLISRPFFVAPNTPAAQVEILRDAFDATVRDGQLLKEAAQLHLAIDPASGAAVQGIVKQMYAAPKSVVEGTKRAILPD